MKLTISIITMNEKNDLGNCLGSLSAYLNDSNIEVFVLDNASTDGSSEFITEKYPKIKLIRNDKAKGFCENHNMVISRSTGEYILILNADVILGPDYIPQLMKALDSDPGIGCVMGKLYWGGDPNGKTIDSMGLKIFRDRRTKDIGQGEADEGQFSEMSGIFSSSGSAMMCRRSMLEDVRIDDEYFDGSFVAYKEELDLCWRARLRGWEIYCIPTATAVHARKWGTKSDRAGIPKYVRRHSFKNRYLMMIKDDHAVNFLLDLPFILLHELKALAYMIFREPHLLLAVPQILMLLPAMIRKRAKIMKGAKVKASDIRKWFK